MKIVDKILERAAALIGGPVVEEDTTEEISLEETFQRYDKRMEYQCYLRRHERTKSTDAFGNNTYDDIWDDMSQLELNFYRGRWLRLEPEDRAKHLDREGRIEDREVEKWFSDYKKHPEINIMGHKLPPPLGYSDMFNLDDDDNKVNNNKASYHTR